MSSPDLNTLKQRLREFVEERDWDQFHSPKNLAMALSAEVAEIVEHFQLLSKRQDLITLILVNDSHLSPTPLILQV